MISIITFTCKPFNFALMLLFQKFYAYIYIIKSYNGHFGLIQAKISEQTKKAAVTG